MPIFAGLKLQEQSWTRPPIYELLRSRVRAIAGKPPQKKKDTTKDTFQGTITKKRWQECDLVLVYYDYIVRWHRKK